MKRFFSNSGKANGKKKGNGSSSATTREPFASEAPTTPTSPTSPTSVLVDQREFTKEELRGALIRLGSTEDEAAAIIAEAARYAEMYGVLEEDEEGEMRAAFGAFDADGNGKISAEEIRDALRFLGDGEFSVEDCRRMIAAVDSDGDGMLCFQDFRRMMATAAPRR